MVKCDYIEGVLTATNMFEITQHDITIQLKAIPVTGRGGL
jgi:hypothetical protein